MKKLLCSVLFAVGFFVAAHAQLSGSVDNNTVNNWDMTISDGNGNNLPTFTAPAGMTTPFGPSPTTSAFPINVYGVDLVTGCIVSGSITGAGIGTLTSSNCALPTIKYGASVPGLGGIVVKLGINY